MLIDSPSIYSPYNDCHTNTVHSVELSSAIYSPERRHMFMSMRQPPTAASLSRVSAIDGTRCHDNQLETGPVNSTFINQARSCVRTLDFTLDINCDLDRVENIGTENDLDPEVNSSSSGYSSNSSRRSSRSRSHIRLPAAPPSSPNTSDSAIYEGDYLGLRPECIGQDFSPELVRRYSQIRSQGQRSSSADLTMMSTDSDASMFMQRPMCRQSIAVAKSKASYKTISRKLKQFSKQFHFHHIGKSSNCSLKTLAVL